MFLRRASAGILCTFLALSGCGGGGGGDDGATPGSGTPTVPPTVPATPGVITFSPAMLSGNQQQGLPVTYSLRVDVSDPSVFTGDVYAVVVDPQGILNGQVQLAASGTASYTATLHTSATLASGRHQGQFEVRLCRDIACAAQYPGSPVALPCDLTITQMPLRATAMAGTEVTAHAGGTGPADVQVSLVAPPGNWTASTTAAWLQILNGAGNGPGAFTVRYATAQLAPGTYLDKATVRSHDGQAVDVHFSLNVLPTQFSITAGAVHFTAVNGAPIAPQQLQFELGGSVGTSWNAVTDAGWLTLTPNAGTTPGRIALQADPSRGRLASGVHQATLRLSSPGATDQVLQSTLTLLPPSLTVSSPVVTLGGPMGRDLSPAALTLSLNTGANAWPWTLGTRPSWLASTATAGTVGQSGATLELTAGAAAVPGSATGVTTLTATVNGDTVTTPITVNLNRDKRRLLPSEWGVGFATTPIGTTLTRTLKVRDNFGAAIPWRARASHDWLQVTPTGTTGDSAAITLTVDPARVPADALSLATVTLDTSTPGVEAAVIQVGMWKDTTSTATQTRLPTTYSNVIADRIRPYVYAHNGATSIDVLNAYTVTRIATIPNVAAVLGNMAVSPDGTRLYALDTANRNMAVVDLLAGTHIATWPLKNPVYPTTPILAMRTNGKEIVLTGDGSAYADGQPLAHDAFGGMTLGASADGRQLMVNGYSFSPATLGSFQVDYSEVGGGTLSLGRILHRVDVNGGSNTTDIAFAANGIDAYIASGSPYHCYRVNAATFELIGNLPGGNAYPNNVEVTSDGRVICGISSTDGADFWVHASNGALLASHTIDGGLRSGQLVVTPDGMVVVALSEYSRIAFVPIGR